MITPTPKAMTTTNTINRENVGLSRPIQNMRIQDKVVLLLLTFRAPGNERAVRDKSVLTTDANVSRLHIGKRLIECKEYSAISIHDERARAWAQRLALPSPFKAGTHVIPLDILNVLDKGLTEFAAQRSQLVADYVAVYAEAKQTAREQLGELYRESEYLGEGDLAAAYSMTWQYVTLAPPSQMETLNAEIFNRERERLQTQWDDAIGTMREALAVGMAKLIEDMASRLGSDKKLKPTKMLERFNEFLTTFDARNVTDDEQLKALAETARGLLKGVDTETLIKSKEVREQVRDGFKVAQATLAQIETVSKKQRQISFTDE